VMAELQTGDVIIGYDGRPLAPFPNLGRAVAETPAGDAAILGVVRGGRTLKLTAVVPRGAEGAVSSAFDHPSPKDDAKP